MEEGEEEPEEVVAGVVELVLSGLLSRRERFCTVEGERKSRPRRQT